MTQYRTTDDGVGGSRGMKPINYPTPMSVHQLGALELAERRQDFKEFLKQIARNLRKHAVTSRERSTCDDVARGLRLSLDGLEVLCELAARSERPFVLEEAIRGQVLRSLAAPSRCPVDTFLDETRAQSAADIAQVGFVCERTSARRDAALDGLGLHLSKLRDAMDALHCWPRRLA